MALLCITGPAQSTNDFEQGSAYLVYAGPYSSSPSSAFGHLFLVFQTLETMPLPLWDVVSFNAETNNANPVNFFFSGITGGFSGTYKSIKFHEQVRDYEVLEDRDLWLIRLNISEHDKTRIQTSIAESHGETHPYLFFSKNCASYIQELLCTVCPNLPKPEGVVSPMEVVRTVIEKGLAEGSFYRPSISRQLVAESQLVSSPVLERLKDENWQQLAGDQDWLRTLKKVELSFIQQYFHLQTLHTEESLPQDTRNGLSLLRVLVSSQDHNSSHTSSMPSPGNTIPAPAFHSYGKLTTSFRNYFDSENQISIRFRPAMHDMADPWTGFRQLNTLEFLTTEISATAPGYKPRLEEFVFFYQRSLAPVNIISKNSSWMFEIATRRAGVCGPSQLHSGISAGWGRSTKLSPNSFVHLLATGSMQGVGGESIIVAPGVQTGINWLISETWRCGMEGQWHQSIIEADRSYWDCDLWVRHDFSNKSGARVHFQADSFSQSFKFDFSWYP